MPMGDGKWEVSGSQKSRCIERRSVCTHRKKATKETPSLPPPHRAPAFGGASQSGHQWPPKSLSRLLRPDRSPCRPAHRPCPSDRRRTCCIALRRVTALCSTLCCCGGDGGGCCVGQLLLIGSRNRWDVDCVLVGPFLALGSVDCRLHPPRRTPAGLHTNYCTYAESG